MIRCRRKGHISRLALASSIISVCVRLLAGQIPPSTHPRLLTGAAPLGETPTLPSYFKQQLLKPQLKMDVWGKGKFLQSTKGLDPAASGKLLSIPQLPSSETNLTALNQTLGGL